MIKGNSIQPVGDQSQNWSITMSRLDAVRALAKQDKKRRFTNLFHHITPELLMQSFMLLKRDSAAGADGVRWPDYHVNLRDNIRGLWQKLQSGAYRPKAARRIYIPKEDGSQRPLSLICLEDKVVQQAVVQVLNQIYETDFMGFSYGFRRGRGQHDALDALNVGLMKRKVNWVLDLDISKFFDTVEHDWLVRFIQHRVGDKRILKLLIRWLKVGIYDESGKRLPATLGTPQGAVISPLLANIYLHYSFDLWVAQYRKRLTSDMIVVRYADDSVLGFQKHADAEWFLHFLKERMAKFGLSVHPDKTRLVRFGRYALAQYAENPRRGKPGTFDFLGFTHYIGRKKSGEVVVKRKTKRSRMLNQLKELKAELRKRLHWKPSDTGRWLHRVVSGHINYYGVPFNGRSLSRFVHQVKRSWLKSLRRRSQRHKMDWERFNVLIKKWLPSPQIVHPYPEQRFFAKYPR